MHPSPRRKFPTVTAASLWLIARFGPLRVDVEGEIDGLDLALNDERGYNL